MLSQKINRYARFGEWAASIGLLLFVLSFLYAAYLAYSGQPIFKEAMIDDAKIDDIMREFSSQQRLLTIVLLFLPDFVGIALLISARWLFIGFRVHGVLVIQTAKRLQRIGIIIVLLGPVRIISELLGTTFLSMSDGETSLTIQFTLDDTDIYALVIGLIIIVTGIITHEAIRLYTENGEFI